MKKLNILSNILGEWSSLFHTLYKYLNILTGDNEDFVIIAGKVNWNCENFLLHELNANMFKCLIFVQGLQIEDKDKYWLN